MHRSIEKRIVMVTDLICLERTLHLLELKNVNKEGIHLSRSQETDVLIFCLDMQCCQTEF